MHLVLPAFTLGVGERRLVRPHAPIDDAQHPLRGLRADGPGEGSCPSVWSSGVTFMRNAISPIITMVALDVGVFLGGVLVIEQVFAWPGIGQQAWRAITFNDVPMVMGTVLFAAFAVTIFNLIADLVERRHRPQA